MGLGWPVYPGAHTLRTDIIGDEIAFWNDQAREAQLRAQNEEVEPDTRPKRFGAW
jgi:hypothetical protein